MPVEMLTYAELGDRLTISPEAARALVKRHRLPRSRSNDGKTLVQVDLTEISHSPIARQPQAQAGHQVVTALKQKIETLQAELIEMKAIDDGPSSDDVPPAASRNSCRDFRARSSGNLRSDRTGRTCPD